MNAFVIRFVIAALAFVHTAATRADDFYRGKSITMISGFGPGAGMDTQARTVARHLPRFIPGEPSVQIQTMEGAAGLVAANYIANRAPRDGLTIATPGRTFFIEPILDTPQARFNPTGFSWIGATGAQNTILWVAATTGVRDYATLKAATTPVSLGALGTVTPGAMLVALLAENGAPLRTVVGYNSSARLILALAQGELQAVFLSEDTFSTQRHIIDDRIALPVLQSRPVIPGVAVIRDVLTPKQWPVFDLAQAGEALGLVIAAPPELPPERLALLRKAFTDMSADKDYRDDVAKFDSSGRKAVPGAEMEAFVASLMKTATPAAIADFQRLRQ